MTFVDAYRSEARATLVGVTSLVAVTAEDVAGRRTCGLSVRVVTDDVAQASERRAAVRADEVFDVPAQSLRLDTLVAEYYLHQRHHHCLYDHGTVPDLSCFSVYFWFVFFNF